jgi:hypothetical protein
VPAHSERGERYLWIKVEVPLGILLTPQPPPDYSGLKRGVSTVADMLVFCTPGCVQSYMLSAEQRLAQVQADSYEVMLQAGALPPGVPDEYDDPMTEAAPR